MNALDDQDTIARAMQLRRLTNEWLRSRAPQERDRTMQVQMAQARGSITNAHLLRHAMNFALRIRRWRDKSGDL